MGHSVDLYTLKQIVGKYVDQYNLITAAGPLGAATLAKMFATKNKLVNLAVIGSGVWFAVSELSTPALRLIQDQFGYLDSLFGMFRR